jgi:MtN3 and saliva related transmembrane protein
VNKERLGPLHGGTGAPVLVALSLAVRCGCDELVPFDAESLIAPRLKRSEIFGFLAGLGTTFAANPDLIVIFKRRSSAGMNPRMTAIMGTFQLLWVYYGLLIASHPVIVWDVIASRSTSSPWPPTAITRGAREHSSISPPHLRRARAAHDARCTPTASNLRRSPGRSHLGRTAIAMEALA